MTISILTLFPDMFAGPFDYSIVKHAKEKGSITINIVNIREFSTDRYKSVDDHPYGGGVGMVMRVDVINRALRTLHGKKVLLDPRGTTFTQKKARAFAKLDHLILVCGHYEGVDERVKSLVDETISIGDYILTGGELPAMVIVDSVVRLLPGVLKKQATSNESFSLSDSLEYPQYTRPEEHKGLRVPTVLLSGDHKRIEEWRKNNSTARKGRAARRRGSA